MKIEEFHVKNTKDISDAKRMVGEILVTSLNSMSLGNEDKYDIMRVWIL